MAHVETGARWVVVGLPVEQLPSRVRPGIGVTIDNVPIVVEVAATDPLAAVLDRTRQACVESYRRADAGLQYIRLAAGLPVGMSGLHVEAQVRRISEDLELSGLNSTVAPIDPLAAHSEVAVDLDLAAEVPTIVVTSAAHDRAVERRADLVEQALAALIVGSDATVRSLDLEPVSAVSSQPSVAPRPPHATVDAWFGSLVAADPSRPVVSCGDRTVDRGQLARLVDRAAGGLAASVGPGGRVLCELTRSSELIAVQLAAWRVGVCVVAVEALEPAPRRARQRALVEPDLIIHEHGVPIDDLPAMPIEELLACEPGARTSGSDPDAAAWGCFTSGTTGEPELVVGTQSNLVHLADAWLRRTSLGPDDVATSTKTVASVAFLSEWVVPVLAGASIRLVDDATGRDPARLVAECAAHRVTWLRSVPSVLARISDHLLASGTELPSVRVVVSGADVLTRRIADRAVQAIPTAVVINQYGATETTSEVALGVVESGDRDPDVGRPCDHAEVELIDDDGQLVPPGAVGQIRVGGPLVAGGGHHLTGDYGRFDRSGRLHFLGRRDRQFTVHGHRVEAVEIEAALRSTGLVRDAAVDAPDGTVHAVVVPEGEAGPVEIRRALRQRVPSHLVPREISVVRSLAYTELGKLDIAGSLARSSPARATPTSTSAALADLIASAAVVLGRPAADVDETGSLADNGGDSFSAIELAERLSVITGSDVGVEDLLDDRPLAELVHLTRPRLVQLTPPGRLRRIATGAGPTPLIWFPGGGGLLVEVHRLAHYLDRPPPLFAHPYRGTGPGERPRLGMQRLVRAALEEIAALDASGVILGGNSYGGLVAASVARAAQRASPGSVRGIVLVDALPIEERRRVKPPWWSGHARRDLRSHWTDRPDPSDDSSVRWRRTFRGSRLTAAGMRRSPAVHGIPTAVIGTDERRGLTGRDDLGWGRHLDVVATLPIPGEHGALLVEPLVAHTAPAVRQALDLILGL